MKTLGLRLIVRVLTQLQTRHHDHSLKLLIPHNFHQLPNLPRISASLQATRHLDHRRTGQAFPVSTITSYDYDSG